MLRRKMLREPELTTSGHWVYVMERVESDSQTKRDWSVVKERFSGLLNSGPNFEPQ